MNINRTIIYTIAVSMICLCLSEQAVAHQRFDDQQQKKDYGIDIGSLSQLYQNSSDYLWLEQQQLTVRADDALEFIAHSIDHGLDPNDYHQDLLELLDPAQHESDAHLFDLLLSDGLLKLIHDISTGRLDPAIVDPKWSIPRTSFNAVKFLQHALSENHLKQRLISLIPTSLQYQRLKAATQRYQDYVDHGGWSKISLTSLLHPGEHNRNIPAIRNRLTFEDETLDSTRPSHFEYYDQPLEQAIRQFQRRHSLHVDGIIGPETMRAMNVSAADRLQQINVNLERLRWLPDNLGNRYIMINLANYQLTAIENDEIKLNMRVIVGKKQRSTPSFSSRMTHIIFNPRWYVPHKLARLDLLPKQQANPDYFEHYNIRVFSRQDGNNTEISPDSIDWQALSGQHFPYSLRQDSGEKNSLGRLKFVLVNPWSIYLHDTPSKSLFNQKQRTFSSGCIRVEDPLALANFSITRNNTKQPLIDMINSDDTLRTELEQPLLVYAIYSTVWLNGDELIFSPDSYQRDQKMAEYL